MKEIKKLSQTLNEVFANPNFLKEIVTAPNKDFTGAIDIVLKYYIATKDTNTHYSLKQIYEFYKNFLLNNPREAVNNTVIHGVFINVFNGNKRLHLEKNGLNYEGNPELKEEIEYGSNLLNQLGNLLDKSDFSTLEEINNELGSITFLHTPGRLVVSNVLNDSPESLCFGQVEGKTDIVIGETKAQHYYRIFEKKLSEKYKKTDIEKYKEGIKLAKEVVDYYCTQMPCIALIETDKILDVPFWSKIIKPGSEIYLRDVVSNPLYNSPNFDWFTNFYDDGNTKDEANVFLNLLTLSSEIPKEAIHVVQLVDFYTLFQINAIANKCLLGTVISDIKRSDTFGDDNCSLATFGEMRGIVDNLLSIDDLDELESQIAKRKKILETKLAGHKEYLEKLGVKFETDQDLRNIYERLKKEEEEVFNRSFMSRSGVKPKEPLRDVIKRLKATGQFDEILENDDIIKQDEYQFKIPWHGAKHTRRVAFFLNLISENEHLTYKDKLLLFRACFNHDIGRIHGDEDPEHGSLSVQKLRRLNKQGEDRLKGLDSEESDIAEFIIIQHSLSAKENDSSIKMLRGSGKENIDRIEKLLKCFKDGDKLDRVRLIPDGSNLREGLDPKRLNFDSSKELEGLAYECYGKLIDILDIEHAKKEIEQYIGISKELQEEPEIMSAIEKQREKCIENQNSHVSKMTENSLVTVDFSCLLSTMRRIMSSGKDPIEKGKKEDAINGTNDTQDK